MHGFDDSRVQDEEERLRAKRTVTVFGFTPDKVQSISYAFSLFGYSIVGFSFMLCANTHGKFPP